MSLLSVSLLACCTLGKISDFGREGCSAFEAVAPAFDMLPF